MLYREIIAVCSQIHTKHINTLCGQNVELLNVKLVVLIVTTGLGVIMYLACLESISFVLFLIFRDLCVAGVGYHHPETCSIS
jgi:hypothetical protein